MTPEVGSLPYKVPVASTRLSQPLAPKIAFAARPVIAVVSQESVVTLSRDSSAVEPSAATSRGGRRNVSMS
jgi:hypothetical protein